MKKFNKLIISICSRDVRYVLSVYEPQQTLIITSSKSLLSTYKLLKLNVVFSNNLFKIFFTNYGSAIYFFGQGNRLDLIILSLVKKIFSNRFKLKIFYKDCYVDHFDKMVVRRENIIWPNFQKVTYYFTGVAICGEHDRYNIIKNQFVYRYVWVNLNQDKIYLNYNRFNIQLERNSLLILLEPKILDLINFEFLSKQYTIYLKPHYLDDFGINISNQIKQKTNVLDRYIPCELFRGYKYLIGVNSTCLIGLENSISLAPILGAVTNGRVGKIFNNMDAFYDYINMTDV